MIWRSHHPSASFSVSTCRLRGAVISPPRPLLFRNIACSSPASYQWRLIRKHWTLFRRLRDIIAHSFLSHDFVIYIVSESEPRSELMGVPSMHHVCNRIGRHSECFCVHEKYASRQVCHICSASFLGYDSYGYHLCFLLLNYLALPIFSEVSWILFANLICVLAVHIFRFACLCYFVYFPVYVLPLCVFSFHLFPSSKFKSVPQSS